MNNKILVFESRQLSYGSSHCFLREIRKELKRNGFEVEYCCIDSVEDNQDILEKYTGQSFLAVIDMNSVLPLAKSDEDYYLDLIHAPFYNFIVDHPMHLHERLNVPLKNYYVICLDQCHAEFIRKYYPHIKDVCVLPYAGLEAVSSISFTKRSHNIAFPATYLPLDYYWNRIKDQGAEYKKLTLDMIDILSAYDTMTVDDAYVQAGKALGYDLSHALEDEILKLRNIDRYIREYFREKAVTQLLKAHMQIDVVGENWQLYHGADMGYLTIHHSISYQNLPEFLADTKTVFNIQPLFTDCPHDRVMNAFINGAAVLSDGCNYLRDHFVAGVDWVQYDRNRLELLPDIVGEMFSDMGRLEEIAANGYEKASKYHTWEQRVKKLIGFIYHG